MGGFGEMASGLLGEGDGRSAGLLMTAGVALLTLVMLRRLWRRRAGTAVEPMGARERVARAGEAARPRETIEQLMVEVQELTRLCAAQMENRALRLERLIHEADERLRRLDRLGGRVEEGRGIDVAARGGGAGALVESRASGRATGSGPCRLLVQDEVDPVTRRVYVLADEGLTPVEIAGRLEEQVGKVELILALRGH